MPKKKWTDEERLAFGIKINLGTSQYRSAHMWIENRLSKPNKCEDCLNTSLTHRSYHWANISGLYKRELSDWKRLCVSCHRKFDGKPYINGICNRGHQLTEGNIYEMANGITCLLCKKIRAKEWYQINKKRLSLKRNGVLV